LLNPKDRCNALPFGIVRRLFRVFRGTPQCPTASNDGGISLVDAAHLTLSAHVACNCGQPILVAIDAAAAHALVIGSIAAITFDLPTLSIKNQIQFSGFTVTSAAVSRDLPDLLL
jgi:hypothetical protein